MIERQIMMIAMMIDMINDDEIMKTIMMILSSGKVGKQHSIGDGGFQLGHHQANLPLHELRAVQVGLFNVTFRSVSTTFCFNFHINLSRPLLCDNATCQSRYPHPILSFFHFLKPFPLQALIGARLASSVHFVLTNWSRQFARVQDRRSR